MAKRSKECKIFSKNKTLTISRPLSEEIYVEIFPSRHTIMNTSDAVSTKPSQAVSYSMEYN